MYFKWKEEYCVGIEEIDNQHKTMFQIGRKISNMIFSRDFSYSNSDILEIIQELKAYTLFHFSTEEYYMSSTGYVHYETHKKEHDQLIDKVGKMEEKYSQTLSLDTLMELINLIYDWVTVHILKSDIKYRNFL